MNLKLLTRLKTRDAAVVYEYLFERLNRSPGSIERASYESIAADLSKAGILTARGAAFTARVIRTKLDELEELEVVAREHVDAAAFTLFVFLPYPCAPEEEKKPEPVVDSYGGRTLFDFVEAESDADASDQNRSQNGNGNGSQNGNGEKSQVAINKENIINNKKINKAVLESNFPSRTCERPDGRAQRDAPTSDRRAPRDAPTSERRAPRDALALAAPSGALQPRLEKRSTDAIRELVDFNATKVAALRALVCRRMWEPSTNPDLIDRVVALVALRVGGTRAVDVGTMIERAKEARDRYERTDGRAGRERIWETVCYQTKRIYETNGWTWTPTKLGSEPRPIDSFAEKRRRFLESVEE